MPAHFLRSTFGLLALALLLAACSEPVAQPVASYDTVTDSLRFEGEVHLRNVRQLTFGGNNAEAYWSYDDDQLVFQSDWDALHQQGCDQIFVMDADGTELPSGERYRQVSTGRGRTTCSYFLPDGRVLYASTQAADPACPEKPSFAEGRYVWPIYDSYDVYVAEADGSDPELLIGGEGYDAEATVSPDGRYVVFTSTRSGDLELWRLDRETGDLLQLTDALGYDGGAFFSPDGTQLVWRSSRPTGEDAAAYQRLLEDGFVEPSDMDLYVADADGSEPRRVTSLPGAQWAPFFHPSGQKLLFASNHHSEGGRQFEIFLVDLRADLPVTDAGALQQITHGGVFSAFPMFSFSGERLAFSSNRNTSRTPSRETNVFVADWVEEPTAVDSAFVAPQAGVGE